MAFGLTNNKVPTERSRVPNPVTQTRIRLIAVIVLGLVAVAAIYFLYTSPSLAKTADAQDAYNASATELQHATARANQGAATTAAALYSNGRILDGFLPAALSANPDLATTEGLTQIIPLVNAAGLSLGTISSPAQVEVGAVPNIGYYLSYPVSVSGTYAQILQFIHSVDTREPLSTVSTAAISTTGGATAASKYAATVTIRLWWDPSPELLHQ